jgi:hypothetical protein
MEGETMEIITVNGYEVAGNAVLAIAISVSDPADAHCFTPDDVHASAFDRAVAWTSPGI